MFLQFCYLTVASELCVRGGEVGVVGETKTMSSDIGSGRRGIDPYLHICWEILNVNYHEV
jgi:hypothetical protein